MFRSYLGNLFAVTFVIGDRNFYEGVSRLRDGSNTVIALGTHGFSVLSLG